MLVGTKQYYHSYFLGMDMKKPLPLGEYENPPVPFYENVIYKK